MCSAILAGTGTCISWNSPSAGTKPSYRGSRAAGLHPLNKRSALLTCSWLSQSMQLASASNNPCAARTPRIYPSRPTPQIRKRLRLDRASPTPMTILGTLCGPGGVSNQCSRCCDSSRCGLRPRLRLVLQWSCWCFASRRCELGHHGWVKWLVLPGFVRARASRHRLKEQPGGKTTRSSG